MSDPIFDDSCAINPSTSSALPVIFGIGDLCRFDVDRAAGQHRGAGLVGHEATGDGVLCAENLADFHGGLRIDLAAAHHALFLEDFTDPRPVDQPKLRIRCEIGDEQILNAGRDAVEVALGRPDGAIREREHDDAGSRVGLGGRERRDEQRAGEPSRGAIDTGRRGSGVRHDSRHVVSSDSIVIL
jgi:hypothetical protein